MSTLVGQKAPDFCAPAVLEDGTLVEDFSFSKETSGKHALIFFYPLDFTFVCPSELISLDRRMDQFNELGVKVMSVSVDSHHTHLAWRNTPIDKGGVGPVRYPMVGDVSHAIAQAYGVEAPNSVALRGAFLIDKAGIVRVSIVNDFAIGREIDELLRLVDAIQFTDKHGEVCPAGWQKGQAGMKADKAGVAAYLSQHADKL